MRRSRRPDSPVRIVPPSKHHSVFGHFNPARGAVGVPSVAEDHPSRAQANRGSVSQSSLSSLRWS
jgi:hypothetical protein